MLCSYIVWDLISATIDRNLGYLLDVYDIPSEVKVRNLNESLE
jgi:hypothetical protein